MLIHFYQFLNRFKSTPAWRNKLLIIPLGSAALLNLAIWLLIYFQFYPAVYSLPKEQSYIPLHYNIYTGIDLFGSWQRIFIWPAIGLIILIVNLVLAIILYEKKEIISHFLSFAATFTQIFLLIATLLTILINI